jgi:drug/metabolite transporter, DME family
MMKHTIAPGGGIVWLIVAGTLWGTVGVTTQTIARLSSTNPLSLSFLRLLVAAPLLLVISWRVLGRSMWSVSRRDMGGMMLIGLLMAADQALYFAALAYAGITVATLISICGAPVLVTLFTAWVERRWPQRFTLFAIGLALVGTVLLIGGNTSPDVYPGSALGILFALGSACTHAAVILVGRSLMARQHPLQVTAVGFTTGALLLGILAQTVGFAGDYPVQGWALILYIGIVPTALAYGLFLLGVRTTPAPIASVLGLLEPLTAAVLAAWLFGESLTIFGLMGSAMLLTAIYLLSTRQR